MHSADAESGYSIYRRRLPHVRKAGAIYFVSWRLAAGGAALTEQERDIVTAALLHFRDVRYSLYAYVVMDDHVHVLVGPRQANALQALVHSWKSYTAHRLQRETGRCAGVWQREYYDRVVRDEDELLEKIGYIATNPHRRWPALSNYRWVEPTQWESF